MVGLPFHNSHPDGIRGRFLKAGIVCESTIKADTLTLQEQALYLGGRVRSAPNFKEQNPDTKQRPVSRIHIAFAPLEHRTRFFSHTVDKDKDKGRTVSVTANLASDWPSTRAKHDTSRIKSIAEDLDLRYLTSLAQGRQVTHHHHLLFHFTATLLLVLSRSQVIYTDNLRSHSPPHLSCKAALFAASNFDSFLALACPIILALSSTHTTLFSHDVSIRRNRPDHEPSSRESIALPPLPRGHWIIPRCLCS